MSVVSSLEYKTKNYNTAATAEKHNLEQIKEIQQKIKELRTIIDAPRLFKPSGYKEPIKEELEYYYAVRKLNILEIKVRLSVLIKRFAKDELHIALLEEMIIQKQ